MKKIVLNWQEREKINLHVLYEHKQSHTLDFRPPGEVFSKVIITRETLKKCLRNNILCCFQIHEYSTIDSHGNSGTQWPWEAVTRSYRPPALTQTAHSHTADNQHSDLLLLREENGCFWGSVVLDSCFSCFSQMPPSFKSDTAGRCKLCPDRHVWCWWWCWSDSKKTKVYRS